VKADRGQKRDEDFSCCAVASLLRSRTTRRYPLSVPPELLNTLLARPPFRFGPALGTAINRFVKALFVLQALPRNAGHHDPTIWTSHEPDRLMDPLTALRLGQSLFDQLHGYSPL
jgi:hypothetical protein